MLKNTALSLITLFLCASLFSPEALAHVKWFVATDGNLDPDFIRYSLNDTAVQIWICIGVALIASSIFLDSKLHSPTIVESKIRHHIIAILSFCTGLSLLLTAYNGSLVAPHYFADDSFSLVLIGLEAIVGLLLMSNRFTFYSSNLLLLLYCGVIIKFGFIETIEYWNVIGIALFLLFNQLPSVKLQQTLKPYSVPVLRIFTGIALITLGLSEKLLSAEYGEAFVNEYHWNFMHNLGFESFTDQLFVLSAGIMEVVLGTILILGTTTRLNILVISGFMLTSNITFFLEGNIEEAIVEIIGHLPIIATAIICVFFGSGQRLKFSKLFNKNHA